MTPEELLKPRYLVISDYPNSEFEVGKVYEFNSAIAKNVFGRYPAIFRKLEWWEMRDEKDMPEYVKPIKAEQYIFKVSKYLHSITQLVGVNGKIKTEHTKVFLPAAEQEYQQYINKEDILKM